MRTPPSPTAHVGSRAPVGAADSAGERRLLEPLLGWLATTGRIKGGTHVALELAWFGRRVDLATVTRTRRTAAYELKLGSLSRALQQAAYNRVAFDRSYVVTGSMPRAENIALAAEHGIGLIVIRGADVRLVLDSPAQRPTPQLRARLLTSLRRAASFACV